MKRLLLPPHDNKRATPYSVLRLSKKTTVKKLMKGNILVLINYVPMISGIEILNLLDFNNTFDVHR